MRDWITARRAWMCTLVCLPAVAATGCGYIASKECCPVYLPHDHLLVADAVRVPPCGLDGQFYGLKQTTWREWPAEWQLCQASPFGEPQPLEEIPPAGPMPDQILVEPPRRIEPVEDEPAKPPPAPAATEPLMPRNGAAPKGPLELFSPDQSSPAEPSPLPAVPPAQPQPNSSLKPSSWSLLEPQSPPDPISGSANEGTGSADGQTRLPAHWLAEPPAPRPSNTRAPRPSKLRR